MLLLQGPVGPFFATVAAGLRRVGAAEVHKINFNGGDWLFYPRGATPFRGNHNDWAAFFEQYVTRHRIDAVIAFGDCRPVHRAAFKATAARGISAWAFEEGYVRPNYVTFEEHGVNGFSLLPTAPAFYAGLPPVEPEQEREVGSTFSATARWAMQYYVAAALLRPWFSPNLHHRPLRLSESLPWVRGFWRKHRYRAAEKGLLPQLQTVDSNRYFIVPLQVGTDSQVHTHSGFDSVTDFLRRVVESFAAEAPDDLKLVVKHHPLDRGYHDYTELLRTLAEQHGLHERLLYVHDLHLPTLLEHARGAIVINSTVGLSALHHGTPVIALGKAIYHMPGLTFQGSLDEFWHEAPAYPPDRTLFWKFRHYVIARTQLLGSFYKPLPGHPTTGPLDSERPHDAALPQASLLAGQE
ncbi:MAG: capsular biosynthesis protein [Caldimonas sp.]